MTLKRRRLDPEDPNSDFVSMSDPNPFEGSVDGNQGPQGDPGIKGDKGDPGDTGPAGPAPAGTGYVHVTGGALDTPTGLPSATTSVPGTMSAADKTKLDGVASGAEVNVNADWTASSGDAQILNKPTLGTAAAKNVGTGSGDVAAGDAPASAAASAVSAHDGAAFPHSGKFDASGAAATVQGNLDVHAALTSTAHGGIPTQYTDALAVAAVQTAFDAGSLDLEPPPLPTFLASSRRDRFLSKIGKQPFATRRFA